jgi:hypothetical protein
VQQKVHAYSKKHNEWDEESAMKRADLCAFAGALPDVLQLLLRVVPCDTTPPVKSVIEAQIAEKQVERNHRNRLWEAKASARQTSE